MIRYLFFITCVITLTSSPSYSTSADSLKLQLNIDGSTEDIALGYHNVFWAYIFDTPDSAFKYAVKGIENIPDTCNLYLAWFQNALGIYYYFTDQYQIADSFYQKAVFSAKQSGNQIFLAKSLNNRAVLKDVQGQYDSSIELYKTALQIQKKQGNKRNLSECYNNIAIVYKEKGEIDKSIQYHNLSTEICNESNDSLGLAYNFNNLGLLKELQGKSGEAVNFFEWAKRIYAKQQHKSELVNVIGNIANVYANQGLIELAVNNYREAIKLYGELKQPSGIAIGKMGIAKCYNVNKEYLTGEKYLLEAISIFDTMNYPQKMYEAKVQLLDVYIAQNKLNKTGKLMGDIDTLTLGLNSKQLSANTCYYHAELACQNAAYRESLNLYDSAINRYASLDIPAGSAKSRFGKAKAFFKLLKFNDALSEASAAFYDAEKAHNVQLQSDIAAFLNKIYVERRDFNSAYEWNEIYHVMKDSILSVRNIKRLTALQLQNQFEDQLTAVQIEAEKKGEGLRLKVIYQTRMKIVFMIFTVLVLTTLVFIVLEHVKKNRAYHILVKKHKELLEVKSACSESGESNNKIESSFDFAQLKKKLEGKIIKNKAYLRQGITLSGTAKTLGTNTNYLSQLVNREYRKNFSQFINELRIDEACRKLQNGEHKNITIEAIAQSVGFKNRSTFNDVFKRMVGVTPSFYIESLANQSIEFYRQPVEG